LTANCPTIRSAAPCPKATRRLMTLWRRTRLWWSVGSDANKHDANTCGVEIELSLSLPGTVSPARCIWSSTTTVMISLMITYDHQPSYHQLYDCVIYCRTAEV